MTNNKPNIFEYEDSRKYLQDLYAFFKATKKQFSFRFFSQQAGFASPNFLKLVMDGTRNLSDESISKFAKGLKLNNQETEFFENLVRFSQATTSEEKTKYYERMTKSRKYRSIKTLEQEQFEYYSHWYYAAVRELVGIAEFQNNGKWISQKLQGRITPKQAEQAIATLLKLHLIETDTTGKLRQIDSNVSSGAEVKALATRNFHREILQEAADAQDRVDPLERDISGIMIPVSSDQIPQVKEKIGQLRKELLALTDGKNAPSTEIYYVGIQFFPLTGKEKKK